MNSTDNITKGLVGLFVASTVFFVAYHVFAEYQNAFGARHNLDSIRGAGELVNQQIMQIFGLHSGLNSQVPFVSQLRSQTPMNKEVIPIESGNIGQHSDNG